MTLITVCEYADGWFPRRTKNPEFPVLPPIIFQQSFGLRWQSAAATPLSARPVASKAAWLPLCGIPAAVQNRWLRLCRAGFIHVHPWFKKTDAAKAVFAHQPTTGRPLN
jgi:hypothetical protein